MAINAAWVAWALAFGEETRFFEYDERKGEIQLTGRVYFLDVGELAIEAWPRPRSKKVKVTKIVVTSPSGKEYRLSDLRSVPMSKLPVLRSRYIKVTRVPFVKEAHAYEDKQESGTVSDNDRTEGQAATAAISLLGGLARSAMTGAGDKEWVSVGEIKTKPEGGRWKLSVTVEDGRGRKEHFYIPFSFPSDVLGPPEGPEPEAGPGDTLSKPQPPPVDADQKSRQNTSEPSLPQIPIGDVMGGGVTIKPVKVVKCGESAETEYVYYAQVSVAIPPGYQEGHYHPGWNYGENPDRRSREDCEAQLPGFQEGFEKSKREITPFYFNTLNCEPPCKPWISFGPTKCGCEPNEGLFQASCRAPVFYHCSETSYDPQKDFGA
mgnify:FL=1